MHVITKGNIHCSVSEKEEGREKKKEGITEGRQRKGKEISLLPPCSLQFHRLTFFFSFFFFFLSTSARKRTSARIFEEFVCRNTFTFALFRGRRTSDEL